jgi:hypothetical protein
MFIILTCSTSIFSQSDEPFKNSAATLLEQGGKLKIGGYGEILYQQPFDKNTLKNGSLDVQRLVMLFGYQFSQKTQFVTEIEFEHVKEVYIEQAFLQHDINPYISFRGGLILIPMGIINELHEPVFFNGARRPLIDEIITPTTWREIGAGFTGNILEAKLRYQLYVVNGFFGYNGKGLLNGAKGLRPGRQKAASSVLSSPNFAARVEFYGVRGLTAGISGYAGNTQSVLYNGVDREDDLLIAQADSSVVGVAMTGIDARYSWKGFRVTGQYYFSSLSNSDQYNQFTAVNGKPNDLGKAMTGFYFEAAYDVFRMAKKVEGELIPFIRWEQYNTHHSVSGIEKNKAYEGTLITTGLSWKPAKGAVLKCDIGFFKNAMEDAYTSTLNAAIGVMF